MSIDVTDTLVRQVSVLARLVLTQEEAAEMKAHLRKILEFVEELQQLDTTGVDPSLFALESFDVYRDDEPRASLPVERALHMAPAAEPPHFVVPRIVGGSDPGEADAIGSA